MLVNSERARREAEWAARPTRVMDFAEFPFWRRQALKAWRWLFCRMLPVHLWRPLQQAKELTRSEWEECEICGTIRNYDWEWIR